MVCFITMWIGLTVHYFHPWIQQPRALVKYQKKLGKLQVVETAEKGRIAALAGAERSTASHIVMTREAIRNPFHKSTFRDQFLLRDCIREQIFDNSLFQRARGKRP
jgi:hypothetical protein